MIVRAILVFSILQLLIINYWLATEFAVWLKLNLLCRIGASKQIKLNETAIQPAIQYHSNFG